MGPQQASGSRMLQVSAMIVRKRSQWALALPICLLSSV
jgi:hypothetical protein